MLDVLGIDRQKECLPVATSTSLTRLTLFFSLRVPNLNKIESNRKYFYIYVFNFFF